MDESAEINCEGPCGDPFPEDELRDIGDGRRACKECLPSEAARATEHQLPAPVAWRTPGPDEAAHRGASPAAGESHDAA